MYERESLTLMIQFGSLLVTLIGLVVTIVLAFNQTKKK
ncbi:putative holin-like toxin [Paenibacillus ihbetae]|nr:putative holin-like toxin [Paenibacillus ihbetae]